MSTPDQWTDLDEHEVDLYAAAERDAQQRVIASVQAWVNAQPPLPDPYAEPVTTPGPSLRSLLVTVTVAATLGALALAGVAAVVVAIVTGSTS